MEDKKSFGAIPYHSRGYFGSDDNNVVNDNDHFKE